jgi:uncharacterized membrane protein HdeD (DUF308 family)
VSQRSLTVVYGVVSIALGVVVQTRPEPAAKVLVLLFAAHLLITGMARLAQAAGAREVSRALRALMAMSGAIWIAVAAALLLVPITTLTVFAVVLGAVWITQAMFGLVDAALQPASGRAP